MIFDDLLEIENCIDAFFETQNKTQPIIFFGAGFALKRILLKFEERKLPVACICDNDPSKQGTKWENRYDILSLKKGMERFPDALYVITSPLYFEEISSNLEKSIDKDHICPIDFECGHYFSGRNFKAFFLQNKERFEKFHDRLYDDASKKALYSVIKAHLSGKRSDFVSACTGTDDWYLFQSLLRPSADSVYLDCGAYDGDTVKLFHHSAVNGYKSILAFEPDGTNRAALQNTIDSNNIKNIKIIKMGAYDFSGRLAFTESGVYSTIVHANQSEQPPSNAVVEIEVTTIDSVLNGGFADIIKMDIEGSEYKALLGAEKTIKKHKPRLAVCLYHNIADFIEIPELISGMVKEYKFLLRHHSKSCTDTILYAVP